MILGYFNKGSGLGNQLHRYVATRVLAKDKDYDFGMLGQFKGDDFMKIDKGKEAPKMGVTYFDITGRTLLPEFPQTDFGVFLENNIKDEFGNVLRWYDPEFNFIEDNTIIDGEFQDERYFGHRLKEIDEWLKVESMQLDENLCIIGFRGGEFALYPDLFLPKEYWAEAKVLMLQNNINMKFEVHTDDPELAQKFFPDYKIIHDIGINWRSVRYSKYAIIANSSFYILPRLLQHYSNKNAFTVSPRYWARRNTKVWSMPQNYYKCFTYL